MSQMPNDRLIDLIAETIKVLKPYLKSIKKLSDFQYKIVSIKKLS